MDCSVTRKRLLQKGGGSKEGGVDGGDGGDGGGGGGGGGGGTILKT